MNDSTAPERRWFVRGTMTDEFYLWRGSLAYVQGWQEITEWFRGRWNWQNFTLIHAAYEDEKHTGHREVTLGLLGLRLRILWSYDDQARGRKIVEERVAEIKAHPDAAVELDDILNGKFRDDRS